jgi:hypothetical protein
MNGAGGGWGQAVEVWLGAVLTLMVLSFLYRDNPLYKLAEHLLVGVSAAYFMVLGFWTTLWPNAVLRLVPSAVRLTSATAAAPAPDPAVLVPIFLGLLMLCRLVPGLSWLSRWPTAFALGTTAGYNLTRYLRTDFLNQIGATLQPGVLVRGQSGWLPGASLDQLLLLIGTLCGLAYFTYTRRQGGVLGRLGRVGVLFMMVTFGASFGYAVMGRLAVLIDRLQFLLGSWLGLL